MTPLRIRLIALPFACLLTSASAYALSDADKDAEAEIFAREEAADEKLKMTPDAKTAWEGTVALADGNENLQEGIVGTFTVEGKAMLLRMESPKLLDELKKVNGKTVTIAGKIRVNGKYFIAQNVLVPVPGQPRKTRGKRGGA